MNEFDIKAAGWDHNKMHWERSEAIARGIIETIPLKSSWRALEYGSGTGITSFFLRNHLKEIIMMDNSQEMVKTMEKKIRDESVYNLKPVLHDLVKQEWNGQKFDLIFTQMALHHIENTDLILKRFRNILNNRGYLAIADLYPEDGSFHGAGFTGHKGFDPAALSIILENIGFNKIAYGHFFTIYKKISDNETKQYDMFLLTASKKTEIQNSVILF